MKVGKKKTSNFKSLPALLVECVKPSANALEVFIMCMQRSELCPHSLVISHALTCDGMGSTHGRTGSWACMQEMLLSNVFSPRRKQRSTPAEESSEEQLLCPDYTVDGLVRCVADCAHWICLCARLLWCALKALCSMLCLSCPILKTVVHCHLQDMLIVSSSLSPLSRCHKRQCETTLTERPSCCICLCCKMDGLHLHLHTHFVG